MRGCAHLLRLERLHGGDAGVDRVAVVGAAAAVELAVLVLGRPGPEVAAPAGELGLLVQVAVHQHGLRRGRLGRRDLEEQHRRAARQPHDLERQALAPSAPRPRRRRCAPRSRCSRAAPSPCRSRATWRGWRCIRSAAARCRGPTARWHGTGRRRRRARRREFHGAGERSWRCWDDGKAPLYAGRPAAEAATTSPAATLRLGSGTG